MAGQLVEGHGLLDLGHQVGHAREGDPHALGARGRAARDGQRRLADAGVPTSTTLALFESRCKDVARMLKEAELDALAYLDFPASHWKRLRTNNVQEHTNKETRRRSHMVQVFLLVSLLERLAVAVMCDQDEAWSGAKCFSEKRKAELCDDKRTASEEPPTPEQEARWPAWQERHRAP